jgi:LmbE family N-acetylglucosaminyl deacetylase
LSAINSTVDSPGDLKQHRFMAGKSQNSRNSQSNETQVRKKFETPHVVSYRDFVIRFARLYHVGKSLPVGRVFPRKTKQTDPGAPVALIFSPHPDDECLVGGLALRLKREAGFRVINVAVTMGGKMARRQARWRELSNACDLLGFELETIAAPEGLGKINLQVRADEPRRWTAAVNATANLLLRHQPRVIFFPHQHDWHNTHVGTHWLVMDALATLTRNFRCALVETEFWGQLASPNLLVESSVTDVADLVAALSLHTGEIRRNPYHLRLPAWLMDNVRRGAELVGGAGGAVPDFIFATLYRLRRWNHRNANEILRRGRLVGCRESLASLQLG